MVFDKKFELTVFTFVMAFVMSGVISLGIFIISHDTDSFMIMNWFESWLTAFLIAFPSARIAVPLIKKYIWILVKN